MERVSIRPAYPVNDFCRDFGVSRCTAYAEIRAGRLKAFKVGDRTMVAGEDALAWREHYRQAGYQRASYPAVSVAKEAVQAEVNELDQALGQFELVGGGQP
jgi:hypothetical protein